MKQEDHINRIMNSLEGMQKAKAPRDGFARIKQKLADQRKEIRPVERQPSNGWMKIAAVITLVICSNIWAVSNYLGSDNTTLKESGSYPQIINDFNLYGNE